MAEPDEISHRILKNSAKAITKVLAIHLPEMWRMHDVSKDQRAIVIPGFKAVIGEPRELYTIDLSFSNLKDLIKKIKPFINT